MNKALSATLAGGILAGALDIAYACAHWFVAAGVAPQRILQSVASGLIGRDAFAGGWPTAVLGLALHFFMTVIMAAFFVAAARAMPALNRWPLLAGVAYGLGLFVVMTFIVVPNSRAVVSPPEGQFLIGSLLAHALLVGAPIAFAAKRYA